MTLNIKLGLKRERRLMKHLEKEHPSTKGNIRLSRKGFGTRKQVNKILKNAPNFKKQAIKSQGG
ncbi:MAG: hypothetical protein ACTSQ4_02150 [Candidatus Heimdallarchaeaceae archaeon]